MSLNVAITQLPRRAANCGLEGVNVDPPGIFPRRSSREVNHTRGRLGPSSHIHFFRIAPRGIKLQVRPRHTQQRSTAEQFTRRHLSIRKDLHTAGKIRSSKAFSFSNRRVSVASGCQEYNAIELAALKFDRVRHKNAALRNIGDAQFARRLPIGRGASFFTGPQTSTIPLSDNEWDFVPRDRFHVRSTN